MAIETALALDGRSLWVSSRAGFGQHRDPAQHQVRRLQALARAQERSDRSARHGQHALPEQRVAFDAFVDETQKQRGKRMTSVGGFLFRKESIAPLKQDLAVLLKDIKKPFSAAECNAQHGEFVSWRYEDCQALLCNISVITAKHRVIGVVCTVDDDDFHTWAVSSPNNAHWFGVPYSLCAVVAVDIVRQYLKMRGRMMTFSIL
jgi:hypothetical protein